MVNSSKLTQQLLKAPYNQPINSEIKDLVALLGEKLVVVYQTIPEYLSLIDRSSDFLDTFIFFGDVDHALSHLKYVFADFERMHFAWIRFLSVPDEIEVVPPLNENDPIPINGRGYYPEDPQWASTYDLAYNDLKRLMLKRDEEDDFWFFDDPFCDESYIQGEVSANMAEIYADLKEVQVKIEQLEKEWTEEVYVHIQDLIEFHTTHHIMVLLRPIQYLIGKDI